LSLVAAESEPAAVYNIGSGTGTSMAQLVAITESVTGRPVPIKNLPPKPEPHTLIADNRLAPTMRAAQARAEPVFTPPALSIPA
jgi:UDP-glucose 4-epimerase